MKLQVLLCLYGLVGIFVAADAAKPAVRSVGIKSGSQGVIVIVEADTIKNATVKSTQNVKGTSFTVRLTDTRMVLPVGPFSGFSPSLPVKNVSVNQSNDDVVVTVNCNALPAERMTSKIQKNRVLLLLTKDPQQEFSWNSLDLIKEKSPQIQPVQVAKGASVTALRFTINGEVEEIAIDLKKTTDQAIRVKKIGNDIIVLSDNTTNGLSKSLFTFSQSRYFGEIRLNEKNIDGVSTVGMIFKSRDGGDFASAVLQDTGTLIIQAAALSPKSQSPLTMHNAIKNSRTRIFASPEIVSPVEAVAMTHKEKTVPAQVSTPRPIEVSATPLQKTVDNTVVVGQKTVEEKTVEPAKTLVSGSAAGDRYVVVTGNTKLLSKPIKGQVVENLQIGAKGSCLKKSAGWILLALDNSGAQGWVKRAAVKDSANLSPQQWFGINSFVSQAGMVSASVVPLPTAEKPSSSAKIKETAKKETVKKEIPGETISLAMADANKKQEKSLAPKVAPKVVPKATEQLFDVQKQEVVPQVYRYKQYGRDPFYPLDSTNAEISERPNVELCKLVGIIYDQYEKIALLENEKGESFSVRENDAVQNGKMIRIKKDFAVFLLYSSDYARQFILKLNTKKD